ncbi:hypothetical protein VNO77_08442 [Canavalia gladiata]|uniref:Secreted protein n=1 Tax=Canavalia gladiata TaxID=3824 RepID=A0AAN9QWL6_CANGL
MNPFLSELFAVFTLSLIFLKSQPQKVPPLSFCRLLPGGSKCSLLDAGFALPNDQNGARPSSHLHATLGPLSSFPNMASCTLWPPSGVAFVNGRAPWFPSLDSSVSGSRQPVLGSTMRNSELGRG